MRIRSYFLTALAIFLSGCGVKDDPVPYLDVVRARNEKVAQEAKDAETAPPAPVPKGPTPGGTAP